MSEPRGECEVSECVRVRGIPFRLPEAERRGGCCCSGVCGSTVAPVQQQQQVEKMHCSFYRGVPRVAHRVHDRLRAVSASYGTSRAVTDPLSASEQLPAAVQRVEPAMPSIHQNFFANSVLRSQILADLISDDDVK